MQQVRCLFFFLLLLVIEVCNCEWCVYYPKYPSLKNRSVAYCKYCCKDYANTPTGACTFCTSKQNDTSSYSSSPYLWLMSIPVSIITFLIALTIYTKCLKDKKILTLGRVGANDATTSWYSTPRSPVNSTHSVASSINYNGDNRVRKSELPKYEDLFNVNSDSTNANSNSSVVSSPENVNNNPTFVVYDREHSDVILPVFPNPVLDNSVTNNSAMNNS